MEVGGPVDEHYVSSIRDSLREVAAGFNVDSERTIYRIGVQAS